MIDICIDTRKAAKKVYKINSEQSRLEGKIEESSEAIPKLKRRLQLKKNSSNQLFDFYKKLTTKSIIRGKPSCKKLKNMKNKKLERRSQSTLQKSR